MTPAEAALAVLEATMEHHRRRLTSTWEVLHDATLALERLDPDLSAIKALLETGAAVTVESLAVRQHDRWGPGFCISDLGEHDLAGCDHQQTWLDFAASDIEALRRG